MPYEGLIFQIGYRNSPPTNWSAIQFYQVLSWLSIPKTRETNSGNLSGGEKEFPEAYRKAEGERLTGCPGPALGVVKITLQSVFNGMTLPAGKRVYVEPRRLTRAVEAVTEFFQRQWF